MAVLLGTAATIGLGSAVAQVLVPLAATLAGPADRGRVVGTVMTGLLLGILLARTVAGGLASLADWRFVYVFAAVVTAAMAVVLRRELPDLAPLVDLRYRDLLASTVRLAATQPLLRWRALYGALGFTCYFVGGGIGSAAASALFDVAGWRAVCAFGAALGAAVVLMSAVEGPLGLRPAGAVTSSPELQAP